MLNTLLTWWVLLAYLWLVQKNQGTERGFYPQDSLQMCLSRRVPLLLARGLVRLVVLDSVAAVFRCEFQAAEWQERTRQMLTVSSTLHRLSREFATPVLCINQVIPLVFHPVSIQVKILLYSVEVGEPKYQILKYDKYKTKMICSYCSVFMVIHQLPRLLLSQLQALVILCFRWQMCSVTRTTLWGNNSLMLKMFLLKATRLFET